MKKDKKHFKPLLTKISEKSENETDNHFVIRKHIETSSKVVQIIDKFYKPKAMKFPMLVDSKKEMEEFKNQIDKPQEMREIAEEEFKKAEDINFNEIIGELNEGIYAKND